MSEVCERDEVIQLTDGEIEQFEAQLKRGPNQAAKRTIARVRKARTAVQADNREKAVAYQARGLLHAALATASRLSV